ncbi:serine protein kinase RIO [Halobacteriales archaeon QS_1_68_20]|nr:MAG: serine protein kinase RIO [Halobacteriales archaeon QS_1_68_20]
MADEYGLLAEDAVDVPGDEWEQLDVSDTEADRIARRRDREFDQFRKRIKDADQFKVEQSVFDDATYAALYRLVQNGFVDALGGAISTGKEANVHTALGGRKSAEALGVDVGDAARGEAADERPEVAVKVYRINASDFKDMRSYLEGDPRFEGLGGDKKGVVLAWTKKEFANLQRARQAGVRVPTPIAVERNALVMEYLGTAEGRARRLSEVDVENPETAYEVVREYMRRLYRAGLVHGDLSEYNVVVHEDRLVVLDLGQAVTVHHPNSREFLERDCHNVAAFFRRQGADVSDDELLAFVTDDEE